MQKDCVINREKNALELQVKRNMIRHMLAHYPTLWLCLLLCLGEWLPGKATLATTADRRGTRRAGRQ